MTRRTIILFSASCLAIVALLATTLNFSSLNCEYDPEQQTQFKVSEAFKVPLTAYKIHVGEFPTTKKGLLALIEDWGTEGWRGPYIERETALTDPWGRPFRYRFPAIKNRSEYYDLYSLGPDGVESADDITNWD